MNIHDLYPSKYLRADDLRGHRIAVIVERAVLEHMGQDNETKLVLYFAGKEKGLIMNKTNCLAIAAIYGPETQAWIGKQIILFATTVKAFGVDQPALRVAVPAAPAQQVTGAAS